ncbi:MAG TPA: glycoside hydrolase family 3 N-terminal domain-containing protein [Acidimicrobiales bacterium]
MRRAGATCRAVGVRSNGSLQAGSCSVGPTPGLHHLSRSRRSLILGRALAVSALVASSASCATSGSHAQLGAVRHDAAPVPRSAPAATTTTTCSNASVLATWPVARRAAQLVVVPAKETAVTTAVSAVRQGAGGVILFGSSAPTDLGQQLAGLKAQAPGGVAPLIMTDEEGGPVQRMPNLVGPLASPRAMTASLSPEGVRQLGEATGHQLMANGVDVDLAPVLDLASGPGPDLQHTDGPRSFSPDPGIAASYGLGFAQGLLAAGVMPVVKHFPGEGQATANSDDAPASTPALSELEGSDLVPFSNAVRARLPAVMMGNDTIPGLTSGPASLSSTAIGGLLSRQLGFGGLVLTDSLSAGSIRSIGLDVPHAAVQAVTAGADMVLYDLSASSGPDVVNQLTAAVGDGTLPLSRLDDAAGHVLSAKRVNLC